MVEDIRKVFVTIERDAYRILQNDNTNHEKSISIIKTKLDLEEFSHQGLILDIAGGGEGVVGQLMGDAVIAIDYQEEELLEAADGPLKVIMDARELKFLDESFQVVTAFFAFMYFKTEEDQLWKEEEDA